MMKLKAMFLCDSANVRDNLLSVLAGGLTRIGHANYPNNLQADLALMFEIFDGPADGHEVFVECVRIDEPEDPIFRFGGPVGTALDGTGKILDIMNFPLVLPLESVGLPAPGMYQIRVELDGHRAGEIHFLADVVDAGPGGLRESL